MWTLLSFALLSSVAVSSSVQYSFYQDIVKNLHNAIPYDLKPSDKESIEIQCKVYADNEAFNNYMSVRDDVIKDIPASTMQEAAKYHEDGETLKSVEIYCKLSPKIKTSISKLSSALNPCKVAENRQNDTLKLQYALLDYICFNNSERVKTYIENGGEECIAEREMEIKQCINSTIREEETINDNDNKVANSMEPTKKENFRTKMNAKVCREKPKVQLCFKKELDQCPSPSTTTFVVGLLDSLVYPLCNNTN